MLSREELGKLAIDRELAPFWDSLEEPIKEKYRTKGEQFAIQLLQRILSADKPLRFASDLLEVLQPEEETYTTVKNLSPKDLSAKGMALSAAVVRAIASGEIAAERGSVFEWFKGQDREAAYQQDDAIVAAMLLTEAEAGQKFSWDTSTVREAIARLNNLRSIAAAVQDTRSLMAYQVHVPPSMLDRAHVVEGRETECMSFIKEILLNNRYGLRGDR